MTSQQIASFLQAALATADQEAVTALREAVLNFANASPRSYARVLEQPFARHLVDAMLLSAAAAEQAPAPLPRSISVDELVAAFARGGHAYERRELRGAQMGGERCPYLTMTALGQGVYEFRLQDEDGQWVFGNAYVSRNESGDLVATH
jgi:hypothetical protein